MQVYKYNRSNNTYIKAERVGRADINDLDWKLREDFKFNSDNEDAMFISVTGSTGTDSDIVFIDLLIESLNKLKKKNANYVAIDYHPDHNAYEITGFKCAGATEDDVDNYEAARGFNQEQRKRIDELELEIEKIKETIV